MAIPYRPDPPDGQVVRLTLPDSDVRIDRWLSYEFRSDFLTPTDSFHFELGVDETGLPSEIVDSLKFGAKVKLSIGPNTLAVGFVDGFEVSAERGGGTRVSIHGRDRLGQTLDTVADPTFQLKEGGTLADLLKRLFSPFGWSSDDHFEIDNEANRNARSGGLRGTPTTKGGSSSGSGRRTRKARAPKPLKSFVLHQTKPYNHESVFHFSSRVAQRFGLWIWTTSDGEKLVVSTPHYEQEPRFVLGRGFDGRGNILAGSVHYDMTDQPSIIFADSFVYGGSGEFGKGRYKAYIINPALGLDDDGNVKPEVKALIAKYPNAREVTDLPSSTYRSFRSAKVPFRPMFLHDDESKTQEQLERFVLREMSLLYRRAVTAEYTVEGHGQTVDGNFIAWVPDTVVDVSDDVAGLNERMYVLGVTYSKSRSAGTTTRLSLVRNYSIVF